MEDDFLELEKQQKELVNEFISSNNLSAFKKIFHVRTMPKEKKSFFLSEGYLKPSEVIRKFRAQHRIIYNHQNTVDNDFNNYKINRYNFIDDPENKDKKMKGNYKWASQKFQLMKMNWAKRRGIPFSEFQIPKVNAPIMKQSKAIDGNSLAKSMKGLQLPKI